MKRLSCKIAEQVYGVLVAFAEVDQYFYYKEAFVYHFSVTPNAATDFKLICRDNLPRTFYCSSEYDMRLEGNGQDRVNPILRKIADEIILNNDTHSSASKRC